MFNTVIIGDNSDRLLSRLVAGYIEMSDLSAVVLYDTAARLTDWRGLTEQLKNDIDLLNFLRKLNKIADLRQSELSKNISLLKRKNILLVISEYSEIERSPFYQTINKELVYLIRRSEKIKINVFLSSRFSSIPSKLIKNFSERWATKTLTASESRYIIGSNGAENLDKNYALFKNIDGIQKVFIEPVNLSMLNELKNKIIK